MSRSGPAGGLAGLAPWQMRLAATAACTLPAFLLRLGGGSVSAPVQVAVYGVAVLAAAFMLAWACEAAQVDYASGLVVAVVAFVAILPEFVVELHFAYIGHAEYVTANLTGASRLLLGFCIAMPAALALLPARHRPPPLGAITLQPANRVDLAVLGLASLWTIRAIVAGRLTVVDSVVLCGLYLFYLWRAAKSGGDTPEPMGVAAQLAALPRHERRRWLGWIMAFSGLVILLMAVPFSDAVLDSGRLVGIRPYLVLQWLVPVATEMPELVVAFVLLTHRRGGQAMAVLLAGAVSQYTLALGTLPLAYAAGRGSGPLPLGSVERVELFLTVGVALFAVAALVTLRLSRADASLMLLLFSAQFLIPFGFTRITIAIVFATVAVDILASERRQLRPIFATLRGG